MSVLAAPSVCSVPAVDRVIYLALGRHANRRVRSLVALQDDARRFVYVTNVKADYVAPAENLVVRSQTNPLGALRVLGLHALKRHLDSLVYFPTRDVVYAKPVVSTLRRRIERDLRDGKQVTLMTSAPPHVLCLAGLELKREFPAIHWVNDWQDLWSYDESYFNQIHRRYRQRALQVEQQLLHECDVNVTTNDFAKRALEQLGALSPERVVAINHHFESNTWKDWEVGPEPEPMPPACLGAPRIVYMGGMFKPPKVPGGKFLEALKGVRAVGRMKPELHLYGRQGEEFSRYQDRFGEYGAAWRGIIHPRYVLNELRRYDYQLLLLDDLPNGRLIMHQKLPEYLVAGPPILAIVPRDSAVADIVERTGTGYVVPTDSDWVAGIREVLECRAVKRPVRNEAEIARFTWPSVRAQWAEVLGL